MLSGTGRASCRAEPACSSRPGDAEAMADAVEQLLEDDALADGIASRAEASARTLFSVDRYVREVRAVVEPLADRHQVDA